MPETGNAIDYKVNAPLTVEEAIDLYKRSTLGERRPVDRPDIFEKMLRHANLTVTAWDGPRAVGIARTFTDFGYVAYIADLAVDEAYQKRGIGKALIDVTREHLDPSAYITLIAAPKATGYYPKIGFTQHPSAWIWRPGPQG